MAYPTIKYDLGSWNTTLDFILYEVSSPNGWSRKTLTDVQVAADVRVGDPITATGTKAADDFSDFVGFSLVEFSPTLGIHTNGDVQASVLYRDAEIKWPADAMPTAAQQAVLDEARITAVPSAK